MEDNATKEVQDVTTEENLVELPDATDEDITAFLESQRGDKAPKLEVEAEEGDVSESEEAAAVPPETPKTTPQSPPAKTVEDLKGRVVNLVKQVEGQELLVQRQLSKLGEIKKEIQEKVAVLEKDLDELYLTNPREAARREREAEKAKEVLAQVDADAEEIERTAEAQKVVAKHIKPEELFLDDMALALAEDGVPLQEAKAFVQNPFKLGADGKFVIQLQRRARAERALRTLVPAFEDLKKENEELKAKLNGATGEVLKKIEAATNEPPKLGGKVSSATAGKRARVAESDIPNLSDEELSELLP